MPAEIIPPGTMVMISDGSIPAMVNCAALYANGGTLYEVVWWCSGSRHSAWVNEQELSAVREKVTVGFTSPTDVAKNLFQP